jgi:WD40 repeat protein
MLESYIESITSMAFSSNGMILAFGGCGDYAGDLGCIQGKTVLWDIAANQPWGESLTHGHFVYSVAFNPDGQILVTASCVARDDGGCTQGEMLLWDIATGQPVSQSLQPHNSSVTSVAFSPDGKVIASGSGDYTVILWDVATGQPMGEPLEGHTDAVMSVAFSPDGRTLASSSQNGQVILWDVATGQLRALLDGHTNRATSVAFSPDGRTLASGGCGRGIYFLCMTGKVILWDVTTGQLIGQALDGHTDWVTSVAFSPDGKMLASSSQDGTIILWDISTEELVGQSLHQHPDDVKSIALSPDGKIIASGKEDSTVTLWEVATGLPRGIMKGHTTYITSVIFSPDGEILASGSAEGSIILWNVSTRQSIGMPLHGHITAVESMAFSPNGQLLASGSSDNTIILWDVATGQQLAILAGHPDNVYSVVLSADDQSLAKREILLWSVSSDSWQARACRTANRNLSLEEWQRYLPDRPYEQTCPDLPPHPSAVEAGVIE